MNNDLTPIPTSHKDNKIISIRALKALYMANNKIINN